jgi:oxepin-CoA hydrolase/3-oxo-5,6-dehydrosuberyl-CoA semialdehyde dehydrogenase
MSRLIHANRDALLQPAIDNAGNTRSDAKFDVDGASATLAAYADVAAGLGAVRALGDGEPLQLGRSARFFGQHVLVPREGVAVHVNAFNFPAWGFAEKAAVALLAGMPVVTKPATATALTAYRIVEKIVEANLLPPGALSFIAGATGDLLTHLGAQDVLAFTGSLSTAVSLRGLPALLGSSVHVNVEADSLNAAVLGADVERGSPTWDLFLADVVKEMTQKAGQKCTAIRRVMVPAATAAAAAEDLADRLSTVKVGDPANESVTMGPLATAAQLRDVRAGLARLLEVAKPVYGSGAGREVGAVEAIGARPGRGFFLGPVLLRADDPAAAEPVHTHEVFGPVATLCPFDGTAATAAALVRRGGGMLVSSIYSDDRAFVADCVRGMAPWNGRLYLGSVKLAGQTIPPGTVLPSLVHGGPGRAGGGEELGGPRGLSLYLQRTALEGDKPILAELAKG